MRHTFEIDQNRQSINIPLLFFLVFLPSLPLFLILEPGSNQSFYLHSVLGSKFCPTYSRATPAPLNPQTLIDLTFVFYSLTLWRLNIALEYFISLLIGTISGYYSTSAAPSVFLGKLFLQSLNYILYQTTKSPLTSNHLLIFNCVLLLLLWLKTRVMSTLAPSPYLHSSFLLSSPFLPSKSDFLHAISP